MKKLKAAVTNTADDANSDTTATIIINNKIRSRRTFDFVIIGTLAHQSKDDAIEYLEHLLNKDKRVVETNIIHIFGDYY